MATKHKLLKSRYLQAFGETWDLATVVRKGKEDENGLIIRIGKLGKTLEQHRDAHEKLTTARAPTLFLVQSQYDALSDDHKLRLYETCHLMVSPNVGADKGNWSYSPWNAVGTDFALWISHDEVYIKYRDANEMNHHFRRVDDLSEITNYKEPGSSPEPTPKPTPEPGDPPVAGSGKYHITGFIGNDPVDLVVTALD